MYKPFFTSVLWFTCVIYNHFKNYTHYKVLYLYRCPVYFTLFYHMWSVFIGLLLFQRNLPSVDKFDYILSHYRQLAGGEKLGFNIAVFLAEKELAHRIFALGYYLKENKCFPDDVNLQQTLDLCLQVSLAFKCAYYKR